MNVQTLTGGETEYVPTIDVFDSATNHLVVELSGNRLSVELNGRSVIKNLQVSVLQRGTFALEAAPRTDVEYSQRNVYEDVYDGVFTDLRITDLYQGSKVHSYVMNPIESVVNTVVKTFQTFTDFFMKNF